MSSMPPWQVTTMSADVAPMFMSSAGLRMSPVSLYRTALLHPLLCRTARLTVPLILSGKSTVARRCVSAALNAEDASMTEKHDTPVRIVAFVGEGSVSPLNSTPWHDVMLHTAQRLKWVDEQYEMHVFSDNFHQSDNENAKRVTEEVCRSNFMVVVAVTNEESVKWIQEHGYIVPNIICFESSAALATKLGGLVIETVTKGNIFGGLSSISQWKKLDRSREVAKTVSLAWDRHNSDDIRFCLLVIINAYITPVPTLKNLRATGFSTLNCMLKNCGAQILNCLLDPNCRQAIWCLNQCSAVDQVCNYTCIASYESPYLEEFSLCVLQKNNCLGLDVKIPEKPHVAPMSEFRRQKLCHETAEDLFVGWLGKFDWSWRVVAGQNPAYDQFPCQYQLFYRGKAKGSFWYEPVFQVRTLDGGALVWRRRKYRVKRGKIPGTFHFSVLDNGVVSNEIWTIVDVCEDLSWGLFHYHGAARVAGQTYSGAVLVSPDGVYPDEKHRQRLISALDRCCIKEWELFMVDNNCSCQDPPLCLPEGCSLHYNVDVVHSRKEMSL
ncbi:unnamed protein product [Cuscuta europaea]|uniref:VDE lipocalin domain-containing protein n=1 Tax=Cuscuta europaea TaxID=41803 RepID=A0A9P0ZPN5_CUSEU|nr:unnamed protein product [Cuscuta europaea]